MLKKVRNYLTPVGITIGVFMLGATAFAVAGTVSAHSDEASVSASSEQPKAEDSNELESVETPESPDPSETPGPNHGHCVSWAAHQSKTDGYTGSDRGSIMSAVAQDSTATSLKVADGGSPDAACSAAYTAATAGKTPSPRPPHGKSGSHSHGHGKSGDHKPETDDND
ncbi:MAG: hypothetical protein ABR507_05665 [Actinomycetota bacterium]|nr:hypothetical protein [Actinomycetota bacterium]